MEAMYCRSAMPCVPDCWGAISHHYLQTNPMAHSSVCQGSHTLAQPSNRDWTKDVKRFSLSLSKITRKFPSSFWTFLRSSTFDLCLLLYVIRLAGWLKHCNSLSLKRFSLSVSAILLMTLLLVCRCDRRLDQAFCICSRSSLCLGLWCQRSIFCLTEMYDTRLCQ